MQKQKEIKEINIFCVNSQVESIIHGADIANGSIDEKKGCRWANQPPILPPIKEEKKSDCALANCTQWMRGYDLSSNAILMRLLVLLAIGLGTNNAVTVPRKNTAVTAAFQGLRFLTNKHGHKYTNCAVTWFVTFCFQYCRSKIIIFSKIQIHTSIPNDLNTECHPDRNSGVLYIVYLCVCLGGWVFVCV